MNINDFGIFIFSITTPYQKVIVLYILNNILKFMYAPSILRKSGNKAREKQI